MESGSNVVGRSRGHPRSGGFTLVELLVVMTIAAILLSMAVPAYEGTIARYRVATEVNSLVSDLQYARSEAVKQGTTVTICASADNQTCTGSSWAAGHVVLTNPGNLITPTAASGAVLLRVQQAFGNTDQVIDGGISTLSFNREGFAGIPAGTWNAFSSLANPALLEVNPTTTAGVDSCVVVSRIGTVSVLAHGVTSTAAASVPVVCP